MSRDLIGAVGTVGSKHPIPLPIAVKITALDPTRCCPDCGGRWVEIELTESAFITPALFCKAGDRTWGCASDITFAPIRNPWVLRLINAARELTKRKPC